jgi:hypothetical protein
VINGNGQQKGANKMHMIIRNIVYANSKGEALGKAKNNMDYLCEGQYPFDYYDTFDEGGTSYWGDRLQPVSEISTAEGRKLVVDGWKNTLRDMRYHLQEIRKITENKSDLSFLVGDYRGAGVWMYDSDGEGIKSRSHLNNVLNKWDAKNLQDQKVFVVPADVHY